MEMRNRTVNQFREAQDEVSGWRSRWDRWEWDGSQWRRQEGEWNTNEFHTPMETGEGHREGGPGLNKVSTSTPVAAEAKDAREEEDSRRH